MTNPGNADETPSPESHAAPSESGSDAGSSEPEATGYEAPPIDQSREPEGSSETGYPGPDYPVTDYPVTDYPGSGYTGPGYGSPPAYETPPVYSPTSPGYPPSGFAPIDYPSANYPPAVGGTSTSYPPPSYAPTPYPPPYAAPPGYVPPYGAAPGGYPDPHNFGYAAPPPATNTLAVWSLVTSLLSFPLLATFWLGLGAILTSIASVVLGLLALNQIKTTGEGGNGLAIAGIVVGGVTLFGFFVLAALFMLWATA